MNSFFEALRQPEYVHVLLNRLLCDGLLVALLFLIVALIIRNRQSLFIALALISLLSVSAWPVFGYGQRGYDRVLAMSDDDGQAYLNHHQELAQRWVFLFYLTAAAGIAAMIAGWKRPKLLSAAAAVVAVLTLGSLVAGAVISEAGGKVRHREFRVGPPPAEHGEHNQ